MRYKITQKSDSKDFIKTFPTYFFTTFSKTFLQNIQQTIFWQHSAKHLKRKFRKLRYKITQRSTSKDFIKTYPTYLLRTLLQHFSNRPYPNTKIILAYFYIIKTI